MRPAMFLLFLAVLGPVGGLAPSPALAELAAVDDRVEPCAASPIASRVCEGLRAAGEGRWIEAEATLESMRSLRDPSVEARATEIDAALTEARAHLGSLEVLCTPAGATITVDDVDRGLAPLERPIRLVAGPHEIRCRADDHEPAHATVTVAAGALESLTLAPTAIDHRPPLERLGAGDAQRIVGIGALSLGGISLAIGLGTLFAGLDAAPPDRDGLFRIAVPTLIASGVLVIAGIVLVLTAE